MSRANDFLDYVSDLMLAEGIQPGVLLSANVPGGDEHNKPISEKYKKIIPFA